MGDEAGGELPKHEGVALFVRSCKFPKWWSCDQAGDEAGGRMPKRELCVPAGVEKGRKVRLLGGLGWQLTRYLQVLLKRRS